jgi:polysaccharide export outer membrane protein
MPRTFELVLALLLAAGAASAQDPATPPPAAEPTAPGMPAAEEDYVLQSGDVLQIKFFYNPELNEIMPIRPDGKISLELVGEVPASGTTPAGLRDELRKRYAGALKDPEVAVIVKEFSGQKIYVGGEVTTPGLIRPTGPVTALQAIIQAGGFRNTAQITNIVILRDQGTSEPLFMTLNLKEGLKPGRPSRDVPLRARDIVFVPKTKIAKLNQFVDQYFRQLLPVPVSLGVSYIIGDTTAIIR